MDDQPILTPGTKITLAIDDIAFGGEGVGRHAGLVVFVPFVAPGETVEVEATEVKKRFARARLVRVITPSPDRVTPPCRYFGDCGGCQYQHLAYEAQLRLKHKQIRDVFQRIGGFPEALIDPVVPCPSPLGYRNRIMIRSQWDKPRQTLNIGYLRAENRWVVDIEECLIAEPVLSAQIRGVRENPPSHGGIKIVLRMAPDGWDVPEHSFFQNNFHLLPKLVEIVRERVLDIGGKVLVDAYCGVGFFSIELAQSVERFVGIEYDAPAVRAARLNATRRNAANGEFLAGRVEDLLPSLLERFDPQATTLILDPPRIGCPPQSLEVLRRVRPGQIVYVSCHPATLARDLNLLCAGGIYTLQRIVPLDMFPQTQHVECVATLRSI